MPASPTFGIAFGGGGARGLAHIHVIEALDELGIRPVAISGSSIGAIMGAGMAAGMTGKEMQDYTRSILSRRVEVATRMWRARPGTFAEALQGGLRVSQFNVERILKAFLPEAIPETFAELKIPLKVTATDYYGHRLKVISDGDLHSALAASAAIPAVFRPVTRDGRLLIDGGIYNPVPFDLIEKDADIIIAVDVVGGPTEAERKHPTSVDLMFGATQLMMQSIIANKLKQCRPDILVRPAVSKYRVLDFMKIDALMNETVAIKDELKREIALVMEARAGATVKGRRGKRLG
ncbi:patatin-like phospholipase family protein [Mesorhizobium helmanticense]|uniref:Patatin n=1 Tax=Mesorhizobium helmanticense TaxID=1776423 RepID=A0A2T4J3D4_9HYPH|nr:patatin-like phospholipase family protein [Mesorhizobium helmanticense]PTE12414.1 Patatin [Mesorhizobium helmanticense]